MLEAYYNLGLSYIFVAGVKVMKELCSVWTSEHVMNLMINK